MHVIDELRRFRMLVAGIYVGIAISSSYGFSIFTEHLKTKYGFTQGDITTISTVGNCCGYLIFYAGIVFDYAGPKAILLLAGFLASLGYFLYGLAFDGVIHGDNMLIKFCVINAIAYFGCPAMDVGTLMPLMLNFPLERGYMVIIQKTFCGLGTSVLMAYFNGWFSNVDTPADSLYSPYSYFLAGQIVLCACIGAYFIDLPPYYPCQRAKARMSEEEKQQRDALVPLYMQQHAPLRRLYIGCALIVVCLIFLTTTSIVTGYVNTSKTAYVILSVITVLLMASFALMALPFQCLGAYTPPESSHPSFKCIGIVTLATEGDPVCSRPSTPSAMEEEPIADADHSPGDLPAPPADKVSLPQEDPATSAPPLNSVGDPQYQGSFWRNLLSLELWLLWLSLFGMWGTATVMQMNAAQIYRSKNHGVYDPARLTLYIAMCGVGSAIGRATSGILDMWLTVKKQRGETTMLLTVFLPCGSLCLCLAYLLFAVIPANGLILPFLLGSIGNGLGWGLGALAVRILFVKDIGKHYNFLFSSGFLSTILLNRVMFGTMFDRQAEKEGTSPFCNHPFCVRNQMWILMAVNGMSTVAAIGVHLRYSRFVRHQRGLWATNPASGMEADTTEVLTDAVEDSAPREASEEPRNE